MSGPLFSKIHYHFFESIDSTNAWIKRQIKEFSSQDLHIVYANEQTAGVGTRGKKWLSPAGGNLYCSFLLQRNSQEESVTFAQIFSFAFLCLMKKKGVDLCFKWPNDYLVEKKKVGGLLCESLMFADEQEALIIGFGLNLHMQEQECKEIDQEASSLNLETKKIFNHKELLEEITKAFIDELFTFKQNPDLDYSIKLQAFDAFLHKSVSVYFEDKEWHGKYMGLTKKGAILLQINDEESASQDGQNNSQKLFFSGKLRENRADVG